MGFHLNHSDTIYVRLRPTWARDSQGGLSSLPLFQWHKLTLRRPDVNLPRTRDLLVAVREHFLPLCQPARGPRNGKQHGEDLRLEAHDLVDDPAVEIHVAVEHAADEILVVEGDTLQFHRDFELRICPRDLDHRA